MSLWGTSPYRGTGYGAGCGSATTSQYELQAIIGTPTITYAAGNPGTVNTTASRPIANIKQPDYPSSGTFESGVIELNAIELGSISWSQETPQGTSITFQTRTGDTAAPDSTWSEWSEPLADCGASQITSPAGKYIQYRINLSTGNSLTTPKIVLDNSHPITIRYTDISEDPLDPYVKVKENNTTSAYNNSGVLIWTEDIIGTRTYYDPAKAQGMIDLNSLRFDSSYPDNLKKDIPSGKLSDAQKVLTIYDKGNDTPVEIVTAGQSITYFDNGCATKVLDKNGVLQVQYTYDEDKNIIKTEFADARAKLEENYQKAVSEIVTNKAGSLAKLSQAEIQTRADIASKSIDMQAQIDSERGRLISEKSKYDQNVYDLSGFDGALADIDDYEARLIQQTQDAYIDLDNQAASARARIEADAGTAMQNLINNDYNKILADIVRKESTPLIYQYYRKVLGRDPGDDELLYWMNKVNAAITPGVKTDIKPLSSAEITQYIQNFPEYIERQARKQNIIANLTSFFAQYLSASDAEKQTLLSSLGLLPGEVISIAQGDADAILSWLNGQSLHFGDSAIETIISMLAGEGIAKSFEEIGRDVIKIDILTGAITKDTTGDLLISMFAMRKSAQANGFTLYSGKVTYDDLRDMVSRDSVTVHIDGRHYVLVTSINDQAGTITYIDPTVGQNGQEMTLSRAEFMERWKGYSLVKDLPQDPARHLNATQEKNIRGSGWWDDFWKGIVNFFQKILAPVSAFLIMLAPVNPILGGIGAVLAALNVVVQTVSFVVRTGTLMDIAWAAINAIGSAIGSQILPNIYNAVGSAVNNIFGSIGNMFTPAAKGMFSSVIDIFNPLNLAVKGIATGIGQIVSFGTAATAEIAASIGYKIIEQGISLGTNFLFKSMNLDPSFANIGSALMSGAIMGGMTGGSNLGLGIVEDAMKYGTIAGVDEIGKAANLDPNITHLAGMMAGSLVGGMFTTPTGKTFSYTELMEDIAPHILSEAAYIGVTEIGEMLGVDPRISYLAGIGIRSSISMGYGTDGVFDWKDAWGGIQQGLLQGVTNIGLEWVSQRLDIPPIVTSLSGAAIIGGLESLLEGRNPIEGIFDTYFKAGVGLLTLGGDGGTNPWLQAAYISQVLDFSRIVQERGIVSALDSYATGFLNQTTINEIWKQGGIADLVTNNAEVMVNGEGQTVKRVWVDKNNKEISAYIDLDVHTDNLRGFKQIFSDGGYEIADCDYVVGPDGKITAKNEIRTKYNADNIPIIRVMTELFNMVRIQSFDGTGRLVGEITPLDGKANIELDTTGEPKNAKITSLKYNEEVIVRDGLEQQRTSWGLNKFSSEDVQQALADLNLSEEDISSIMIKETRNSDGSFTVGLSYDQSNRPQKINGGDWLDIALSKDGQERIYNANHIFGYRTNAEIGAHRQEKIDLMMIDSRVGDTLIINGRGFSADTIKIITDGPANHTSMVFVDDAGDKWIMEMPGPLWCNDDGNLRFTRVSAYAEHLNEIDCDLEIGRRNDLAAEDLTRMSSIIGDLFYNKGRTVREVRNSSGEVVTIIKDVPYNTANVFAISGDTKRTFTCSSLVDYVYDETGKPLVDKPQLQVSPVDIRNSFKEKGEIR